ncbi:MAG: hypothetical protein AAFR55_06455, partial [Pseudomonadota bacterium]
MRAPRLAFVCLATGTLGGCLQTEQFTPRAIVGAVDLEATTERTVIHAAVPVDLRSVATGFDAAVLAPASKYVTWLRYGGCIGAKRTRRCYGARLTIRLAVAGEATVTASPTGAVAVSVPLSYDLSARGLRRARSKRDRAQGTLTARVDLPITIGADLKPVLSAPGRLTLDGATPEIFGKPFNLTPWTAGMSKRIAASARRAVAPALEAAPLKQATAEVWARLHRPLLLTGRPTTRAPRDRTPVAARQPLPTGDAPAPTASPVGDDAVRTPIETQPPMQRALIATPRRVVGADAATHDGTLYLRAAIETGAVLKRTFNDAGVDANAETVVRALDDDLIAFADAPVSKTTMTVVASLPITALRDHIATAFVDPDTVASRAAPTAPRFEMEVGAPIVRPAHRLFAIELPAKIITPVRLAGRSGVINLVGRPRLDIARRTLELTGVSFPVITDTRARRPDPAIALTEQAFAARLAKLPPVRLDNALSVLEERVKSLFGDATWDAHGDMRGPRGGRTLRLVSDIAVALDANAVPSVAGIDVSATVTGAVMLVLQPGTRLAQ